MLLGKKSTLSDHCHGDHACDATGLDASSGVDTWSTIGTAGLVVGVLGVTGFFLLPRQHVRSVGAGEVASVLALDVGAGPRGAGAWLRGRW